MTTLKTRAKDVVGVVDLTPGDRLRTLRELRGMTQKELEAASEVKQGDISAIERDKKAMGLIVARRLAGGLGVRLSLLLGEDTSASTDPVAVILNTAEGFGEKSGNFLTDIARLTKRVANLDKEKKAIVHRQGSRVHCNVLPS